MAVTFYIEVCLRVRPCIYTVPCLHNCAVEIATCLCDIGYFYNVIVCHTSCGKHQKR